MGLNRVRGWRSHAQGSDTPAQRYADTIRSLARSLAGSATAAGSMPICHISSTPAAERFAMICFATIYPIPTDCSPRCTGPPTSMSWTPWRNSTAGTRHPARTRCFSRRDCSSSPSGESSRCPYSFQRFRSWMTENRRRSIASSWDFGFNGDP